MSQITIILNGEEKTIADKITISQLILDLELDITKIAVEKDLEIINPDQFEHINLNEGNKVEIVHFIGGG